MSYDSCIHYKFGNTTNYCSIKFQGLEISLSDLKSRIIQVNHMNHSPLQIINAQNKKVYSEDSEMIPRNTSVIVKRIPPPQSNHSSKVIIASQRKRAEKDIADKIQSSTYDVGSQEANLSKIDQSEENKLKTMMDQACIGFEQSVKKMKDNPIIRCYRCERLGHHRDRCPLISNANSYSETPRKRPKGIPSTMLEIIPEDTIDKHNFKEGVYVNRKGDFVIPIVDKIAMKKRLNSSSKSVFSPISQRCIPNELQCKLCYKVFTDAVVIHCCGNSFCDECIRTFLINNNFRCPLMECGKCEILPDSLVPNQYLRKTVKHFLANIAEEKYNSHPISPLLYTPESKCTPILIPSCEVVEEQNVTKETGEVLTKFPICEDLIDNQPQDSFVPVPFLFNSHNLYISSFHCNTVPSRSCDHDLTDSLQPHKTNTEHIAHQNQELSLPRRFNSEDRDSLFNLESQFYPILSEKEFYLQQTLYRKRQSKSYLQFNNYDNEFASKSNLERKSYKKHKEFSHLKDELNTEQNNPQKLSIATLKNSSNGSNVMSDSNILKDFPNSSKIAPTEEFPSCSGQLIKSPINLSKLNIIHNNHVNDKLYLESDLFQEDLSCIQKEMPGEQTNWSQRVKREDSSNKMLYCTTERNIDLSRSLTISPMFTAQTPPRTFDHSENDMEKNDSLLYNVVNYPDSSELSPFHSNQSNNQSCLNYSFYKGVNNIHQCRLQSTVKKVLSNASVENVNLASLDTLSEHIRLNSREFIQLSDSKDESSEDYSELEDGQIVSSSSGSRRVPNTKRNSKHIKSSTLKLKNIYPEINSSNTKDSILEKETFKNQSRRNIIQESKRKTPDRVVVIKPSSKSLYRKSRNNQTLFQRSMPKRPISIYRSLPNNSQKFHKQKRSRLLMTKTEDERIVKIQTTRKKLFTHSNISFTRDKIYPRKRTGFN